tara:strand:- start:3077 stop:4585 length:1509 start_codon:yes stop_codon:yes gene_type:complete
MTIKIYQREIEDGVGELVKSTASVAYCSAATLKKSEVPFPELKDLTDIELEKLGIAKAENKDQIDLHYIESVLVSCGWNKNDDVFLAKATWEARNTPEDKQFNFMHDENDIIGHITGSYVLTKDGKAVADDSDMPEDFDIISQAVLYNSWTGAENRERMQQIIAEIKEGKWFVSMECLFSGFDYALTDSEGNSKLLARNEESAFLTKHLRAYGGSGEYEGYKVGRALSNISFSGKGLVSKPANPRSVILNNKSTAQFNVQDINSNHTILGDIIMSDTSLLEKQLAEVQTQLSEAKAENEAIKAKIEEAKDKEFASQVEAFEAKAEESQATIDELNETIKSTQARVAELEDQLNTSTTELAEAMKEMDKMKKKEAMMKRKASLEEAGFEAEEIEESLATFESLADEAFEAVVALMKKKAKKDEKEDEAEAGMPPELKEAIEKKKKEKEAKAEEEAEAEEINQEAFEDLESSEATLVESEELDESEKTRASVADWFESHVLNTK